MTPLLARIESASTFETDPRQRMLGIELSVLWVDPVDGFPKGSFLRTPPMSMNDMLDCADVLREATGAKKWNDLVGKTVTLTSAIGDTTGMALFSNMSNPGMGLLAVAPHQ